ncbi:MAG: F0F1 ATP synthase subunit A [Blastocatellia bacterium]|nr:F0F1 ATP synthase subunit A [Blastocatellia bacterium]
MAGDGGLFSDLVLKLGPVEITGTIVYTLVVSAVLVGFALLVRAGMQRLSGWQMAAEFIVEHFEGIMQDMFGCDPRRYTPLVVTLALFIGAANLFGLLPGMRSPTADFSTTAALAVIVFLAVPFYGIRTRGLKRYLKHYMEPTPIMLPLEIITEFSRTLALAVRLFGNVMSEELVIAILLLIAGLLVPVPLMLLAVLTGVVQAYIFAVLTVVYLSAAIRSQDVN